MMQLRSFTALFTFLASTATADVDACVVGTWQADLGDIATMMATQMQGAATHVSGRVTMQITAAGTLRTNVEDMTLQVKVPNAPQMDVAVQGYSAGAMQAAGNAWAATATDYNLVGSADVMGTRMQIPFTSATGMFGSGAGSYTCAGGSLTFSTSTSPAKIPPNWTRLD